MEFRKYKVVDSSAVREFYSMLRAAIKGARSVGRLDLLVNDQTVLQDALHRLEIVGHQKAGMGQRGPGGSL